MAVEVKDKLVTVESAKVIHDSLNAKINAHANQTGNAHGLTCAQLGAVPTSRTVNGKPLSANVSLTASDVGAAPSGHTHTVDSALSKSSSNPVQNKVVSAAISQLSNENVNTKNTADSALTKANNAQTTADSKATVKTVTANLSASGWSSNSKAVTVSGVSANNTVIVTPAPNSHLEYANCMVRCTAQAANKLTFTCEEVPANALTVNVVILS